MAGYGHIYASGETHQQIRQLAADAGVPMSQLLDHAIQWYGAETARRLADAEAAKQAKLSA